MNLNFMNLIHDDDDNDELVESSIFELREGAQSSLLSNPLYLALIGATAKETVSDIEYKLINYLRQLFISNNGMWDMVC